MFLIRTKLIIANFVLELPNLYNYDDALNSFTKALNVFKKEKHVGGTLLCYYAIGDTYRFLKEIDSSIYYNNLGYKLSLKTNNLEFKDYFLLNNGASLSDVNRIEESQKNLKGSMPTLIKLEDKPNIAMCHFFLGRNYYSMEDMEKSIYHMKAMDSIFLEIKDLHPELRQGYEILIKHYKSNNDLKQQLIYVNRVLSLDSIINKNYRYLDKKLTKEYDQPKLIAEQKRINLKIKKNKK